MVGGTGNHGASPPVPADIAEEIQMFQYSQLAERAVPQVPVGRPPQIRHGTFVLDANCTIVGCDDAAVSLFGHARRPLIGTPISVLIPDAVWSPEAAGDVVPEGCAFLKLSRVALDARHADGSLFPVMASLYQGADGTLLLRVRTLD